MSKFYILFISFTLTNNSFNDVKGQLFTDIESNITYFTDADSAIMLETLKKFTYSFCQLADQIEWNKEYRAQNYNKLYKIIGVYSSIDTTYCQKILISRALVYNNISYYDSMSFS